MKKVTQKASKYLLPILVGGGLGAGAGATTAEENRKLPRALSGAGAGITAGAGLGLGMHSVREIRQAKMALLKKKLTAAQKARKLYRKFGRHNWKS